MKEVLEGESKVSRLLDFETGTDGGGEVSEEEVSSEEGVEGVFAKRDASRLDVDEACLTRASFLLSAAIANILGIEISVIEESSPIEGKGEGELETNVEGFAEPEIALMIELLVRIRIKR